MVPSSSAHCATGSTTSAWAAVSDRNEIGHHQQVEGVEPGAELHRRRRRNDDVRAEHQEAAYRRAERRQQFGGGQAGPRQVVGIDAPDRGDLGAMRRDCRACDSREAGPPSGRARGRPGRCPGRSGSHSRSSGLPALPSASARLMNASTLSTPWLCCSGPRAGQHHGGGRFAHDVRRPRSILRAGTPVMRSTRSGQ